MKTKNHSLTAILCGAALTLLGAGSSHAAVAITGATGGTAISADTAGTGGSGAWTPLGPITLAEGANGDFGITAGATLVLRVPAGFEFNTAVTPSISYTADRNLTNAEVVITDATTLTITIGVSNNTALDTLIIGGTTAIEVRPTVGTPLATGRRIYRPTSGGGTATITGITASADGTSGSNFGNLTEVVGAASAIRVETTATGSGTVVAAQNVTAGNSLTVYAIVRDQFGNFVTNAPAETWSLPTKTGGVVDGDLVPAGNLKSAVFTGHLTGTATIQATSGVLTPTDSGTLTVVAGSASKLVFLTAPQALTAGVTSGTMTVQSQDAGGNAVNAVSARTVNLTKTSAAGLFRDAGDTTTITSVSIPIGANTASFLYRDTLVGSPTLTAASSGLTSGTQVQTVAAAAPAMVRVETLASGAGTIVAAQNITAGNALTVYAIARDAFTNFIANIAADAWSLPAKTGGVDDADLVPNGDSKSAVFTGRLVGTATVEATSGALTPINSGTLTVVPGTATKLFVTLPGQTFTAGVGVSGTPDDQTAGTAFAITKLTATDNFTNIATGYTGSKTIAYTGPGGTTTYITSVSFTAGQSTTVLTTTLRRAESTTITASSGTSPAVTGVTSSSFTVNPGAFARLQLLVPGETAVPGTTTGKSGTPTARTAAVAFPVTVNGVDTNWNVITTLSDTVGITSSDANAELPADAALAGGTQTFNVTLKTAGSRTLTATDITDGSKTANTSPAITVNAGAFVKLQLLVPGETAAPGSATGKTGTPNAQTAGTQFSVTVNGVDANWNVVTTAPGNSIGIQASDANATLPANNSLSSGTRSFNVTLKTVGSHTLTATNITDGTKSSDTSPAITLNAGTFTKLQLLVPGESAAPGTATGKTGTPSGQVAGTAFDVIVNAVDANWNLINTNDTVAITSSDAGATLPANAALVAGTQTLSVTLRAAGARTVTAADVTRPAITANTSPAIAVSVGGFAQLQVLMPGETAAPGSVTGKTGAATARTAGTAFSVTINAVDANWNLISTNDTVAITSSDATATLPADGPLVAGTRTVSVTLKTAGTQSVTAADVTNGGIASNAGSALVNPAAANKLVIATEPSATAEVGVPFVQQPVILISDVYNNIRSNDTLTVTASRASGAGTLLGATNVAAVGGVVNYTNLAHSLATNITLRFVSGSLLSVTSAPVAVSAGGFTRLLALLPGETHAPGTPTGKTGTPTATAGTNTPVRVLATDVNFNLVDTVTDTVGLTSTDANAVLPANVALINGTNTLEILFKTSGAQTVTASDISDGGKTASATAVTVSPGAFVKLQLLVPGETAAPGTATGKTGTPTQQLAGTAFNVIVNGVDANWNVTPSASGTSHTILLSSTDANATLGSQNLSSGTRTFSVTLRTSGLNTITATHVDDPTKTASTSPNINVVVGPFVKLQLLLPGETAVPGSATGKTGTPTPPVAGVPFSVTVNAVDAAWNLINTNDTVRLTATDVNAVLPADAALVNGTQTLSVTLKTAGTRTVTASDLTQPAITANTSPSLVVSPAAYAALQVIMPGETAAPGTATGKTGTPTARVAGTAFSTLTVNAVDSLYNLVPTNVTVAITSSDTNAVLPVNSALGTDGTKANFAFTFKTAGTQTITATDVSDVTKTNTSALTVVSPGAYTKLQLLVPGEIAAPGTATGKTGTPLMQTSNITFTVTVQSVDANWNLISTNDNIRITSNDTNAILPAINALAAGTQTFDLALLTVGTNLTVTATNVTRPAITLAVSPALTVSTKPSQTITFAPLGNLTYGAAPFSLSATASSGLPVSFSVLSGPATLTDGTNVTITGAGTVTIRAAQAGDENYNPAPDVDRAFTVTPALLTVTAEDQTRGYGAANPAFTAGYSGFVNGETNTVLSGTPALTTTATTNSTVGNYPITGAVGTLTATNYTFTFVNGNLEITPAPLLVTAANKSRSYGASNPTLTASYTGLMNGETAAVLGGAPELNTTADTNSPVAVYPITAAVGTLTSANYTFSFADGTLTVTPATLTVTANNAIRNQGETNPVFTVFYSGFVNGEDTNSLSGAPDLSTTATIYSASGTYPITVTAGTLTATNYSFTFVNGTLTVLDSYVFYDDFTRPNNPGSLAPWVVQTGDWSLVNDALTGGPNAAFTYGFIYLPTNWNNYSVEAKLQFPANGFAGGLSGRLNSDTGARYAVYVYTENVFGGPAIKLLKFSNWETFGYNEVNEAPMGTNSLGSVGTGEHNLKLAFEGARIRVYYDGNEVLDVTDTEETTYASGGIMVEMGNGITPWQFTVDNVLVANLSLAQTITFDPLANKTYGDVPFALTATASSALPVSYSVLAGPALITDATNVTLTGAGPVTIRASQAGDANYNAAPNVDQSFTVNPATLTGGISAASKVYDGTNSATITSRSLTGVIGSDDVSLSDGTATFANKNVGTGKTVTATGLSLSGTNSGNYSLVSDTATTTADITPRDLVATADDQTRNYGDPNPTFTGILTGVQGSDDITANYTSAATPSSPVGPYPITPSLNDPGSNLGNYSVTLNNGTLTINPIGQTITFDPLANKMYGDVPFALTATASSALPVSYSVLAGPALITDATNVTLTGAGPVTIRASQAGDANYNAAPNVDQSFTVNPAVLTGGITAANKVYDGTNSATITSRSLTGVIGPDDVSLTGDDATFANKNVGTGKTVTATGLSLSGTNSGNYSLVSDTATTTADITPRDLVATADDQTRNYGDPNPTFTGTLTGVQGSDDITANYTSAATPSSPVGPYPITPSLNDPGSNLGNYSVTLNNGTLTINPIGQTITFDPLANKTYGDVPFALTATASSTLPVSYSVLAGPALITDATNVTLTGAGLVTIRASQAGNVNYNPAPNVDQSFTVNPTILTGSITAANKVYDGTNSATITSRSLTGVIGSDDVSLSDGTATFANKNVGNGKTVTATGLSLSGTNSANYSLLSDSATTTADITPRDLVATADDQTRNYGDANPTFTGTLTGVQGSDDITANYTSAATPSSPVGPYPITPSLNDPGSNLGNYSVTLNDGTLTINSTTPSTIGLIQQLGDGNMHIVVNGTPGQIYLLQATPDISPASWSNIGTNTANGAGVVEFTDLNATNNPARFYRTTQP